MTYRQGGPNNAPQAMFAGSGLLMWGRITSSDIVLEPAFRVATGDLPGGDERHFAFVVPLDDATERDLAGLRVRSGVRSASRLPSPGSASSDPEPQLSR